MPFKQSFGYSELKTKSQLISFAVDGNLHEYNEHSTAQYLLQ